MAEQTPHLTADISSLIEQESAPGETNGGAEPSTDASTNGSQTTTSSEATQTTGTPAEDGTGGGSEWDPEAERLSELANLREAAQAFERSVKAGQPIGRIVIPAIGVDVVMVEGTGKTDLKQGPGHWPETPFPGEGGNFVVSGHRTTYGAPFRRLNDLKPGDDIFAVLPYSLVHYQVTDVFIVYPDEVETVAQRGQEQISLAACHPLYSAKKRIVVQGDMVGFVLLK